MSIRDVTGRDALEMIVRNAGYELVDSSAGTNIVRVVVGSESEHNALVGNHEATVKDPTAAPDPSRVAPRINLEFADADIKIVLDLLAKQSGLNIVVAEGVTGKVSVSLRDVECREALETVVEAAGYELVDESAEKNLFRVVAPKE